MISLINITIGLIYLLLLPGLLFSYVLFGKKKIDLPERIALSIALSIMISILLGMILYISNVVFHVLSLNKFYLYFGLTLAVLLFVIILIFKKQPHR